MRDMLAQLGVRVRLIKLLGVGGNGVATLFEVWPGGDENGPSQKVVVKSVLKAGRNMSGERSYNMVRGVPTLASLDTNNWKPCDTLGCGYNEFTLLTTNTLP